MRREASRIWKVLDYIFEVPPQLPPKQKAELILTDLRDRMETYHTLRKMKISNKMEQRVSDARSRSGSLAPVQMVDSSGQMLQQNEASLRTAFSPPNQMGSPNVDESRASSVTATDASVPTMEEIDWVSAQCFYSSSQLSP